MRWPTGRSQVRDGLVEDLARAGGEVTLRTTNTGKQVANFSVAVNERFGDKEQTTWFQVVAWEQLAQITADRIVKGQLLLVEGRVSAAIWADQDGDIQVNLKLTARNIRFLGGKPGEQAPTILRYTLPLNMLDAKAKNR